MKKQHFIIEKRNLKNSQLSFYQNFRFEFKFDIIIIDSIFRIDNYNYQLTINKIYFSYMSLYSFISFLRWNIYSKFHIDKII